MKNLAIIIREDYQYDETFIHQPEEGFNVHSCRKDCRH
jgi:hypothetical protein